MILRKNNWNIKYKKDYDSHSVIEVLHKANNIDDYVKHHSLGYKDLYSPYLFKNMAKIVERISKAIEIQEKILIYGDYDVDGITATSLTYRVLKHLGANVYYHIPDRFSNGYGLSMTAVSVIIEKEVKLVITVDNGITSIDEIGELISQGIDVILTDHHEPKEELPNTPYILHCFLEENYPFRNLAGVGVAFKLAEALDKDYANSLIELATLGTIADMMPLVDENKAIVNEGLKRINYTNIPGLKALLKSYNVNVVSIKDISFTVAPKINSLGRLGKANIAIELLINDDNQTIQKLIKELLEADELRKQITLSNIELAESLMNPNDNVNIVYSNEFFEGVLGIIAQRISKKTKKVTGVFYIDEDNIAKGSFRSVNGQNLLSALEKSDDLLIKYGGHEMAAGVTLDASNLDKLKERLNKEIGEVLVKPALEIELALNHDLASKDFYYELKKYNLEDSLFLIENAKIIRKSLLIGKHTKLALSFDDNKQKVIEAIIFNDPSIYYNVAEGDTINLVCSLTINSWNNVDSLQFTVHDYEINYLQVLDYRNSGNYNEAKPFFNQTNSLVITELFESLNEFNLLLREQNPTTVYLGYLSSVNLEYKKIVNIQILREIFLKVKNNRSISINNLISATKLTRNVITKIITILEEVQLVKNENDIVVVFENKKVVIEDSKTYQYYLNLSEVQDLLVLGKVSQIRDYIMNVLE